MTFRRCVALAFAFTAIHAIAHSPPFSDGLVPAKDSKTNKWGYLNKRGEWTIQPKVDKASGFSCGRALVKIGRQTFVINTSGKTVFTCEWRIPNFQTRFSCGMLRIIQNEKQGFVNLQGQVSIAAEYNKAEDFSDGFSAVTQNGKSGFIDIKGNVVIPLEWEHVKSFQNGLAAVKKEGKWGFIDKLGKLVIPLKFHHIEDYKHGLAIVRESKRTQYAVINYKGENLASIEWNIVRIVGEDRIIFQHGSPETNNHLWGLANSKGKILVDAKWGRVSTFNSGLAVAVLSSNTSGARYGSLEWWGKTGFIDRDGVAKIPYKFDYANGFHEGLAPAKQGDKFGYINSSGNFVFENPK